MEEFFSLITCTFGYGKNVTCKSTGRMWYGSILPILVYNERKLIQIKSDVNASWYLDGVSLTLVDMNMEWVLVVGS